MVSTNRIGPLEKDLRDNACYTVPPRVRVRKEPFGLLFYNIVDARLTFVRSGDLLQTATLPQGGKMVVASFGSGDQGKAKRLLESLLKKGLIFEA